MTPSPTPSISIPATSAGADAHAIQIAFDRDVIGRDLLAIGIEEHDVGLAHRRADDVGALYPTHDGALAILGSATSTSLTSRDGSR